jgi:4-methylaminobutanoate oxidase (formaldehyde-forming)
VGLAYVGAGNGSVINADWVKAGSYDVNVGGQLHPITVSLQPIYDPTNARIRP